MYVIKNKLSKTLLERETTDIAESIEEKICRAITSGEPIKDTAPLIYTERKDGVRPEHDIRTDRQELALDATDKFTASERARLDYAPEQTAVEQKPEQKQEPQNT